jgi:hypothetical protein
MYQVYGFAISSYIDKNGLPHVPMIVVDPDLGVILQKAVAPLTELLEQITGNETSETIVAGTLVRYLHEIDSESVVKLLELLYLGDLDEQYDQAPQVYLAIDTDEDDLEDKLIALVGDVEDDDELDEDYLDELEELEDEN